MPKQIGDKVFFHYGSPGDVKPYPATVARVLPADDESPEPLELDVEFSDEVIASGIAPHQSHSIKTSLPDPQSGGWTETA